MTAFDPSWTFDDALRLTKHLLRTQPSRYRVDSDPRLPINRWRLLQSAKHDRQPLAELELLGSYLWTGEVLQPAIRNGLALALLELKLMLIEQHRRGRPRDAARDEAAYRMHRAIMDDGLTVKAAACKALPEGDAKSVAALVRRYQKINAAKSGPGRNTFGQFLGDIKGAKLLHERVREKQEKLGLREEREQSIRTRARRKK